MDTCEIETNDTEVDSNAINVILETIVDNNDETIKKSQQNPNDNTNFTEIILDTNESNQKVSSLSAIAIDYGYSDSDTESSTRDLSEKETVKVVSTCVTQKQPYRSNKEVSSSSEESGESDSEDDCSSSSSSDSSSIISCSDESDIDNDTNKKKKNNARKPERKKLKNELDDLPPIEDLQISVPEVLCDPLGEIAWIVDQLVVVKPKPGKPTVNLDTVLFIDKGQRALGKVFDVFGQVKEPHYCVRFNSSEHIHKCEIKVGMTVYFCPNTEYTSLVFIHELMKIKGSDTVGDDEPPEFSDDEEERAYYEKLKQKQANSNNTEIPSKRKRVKSPTNGWQSNHPWNRNSQRFRNEGPYANRSSSQFSQMPNPHPHPRLWEPYSYQNGWAPMPRYVHPAYAEQYGHGPHATEWESMQDANYSVNSTDQRFQDPQQNYHGENSVPMPFDPRVPPNVRQRFPFGFPPFVHNRPNLSQNMRFPVPWQPRLPAMTVRMNAPWVSLPPPPPPPPPLQPPSPASPGTN